MNILSYIRDKFGSQVSKVTIEDEKGNVVTEKELKQRHSQALKDTIQKSIELIETETSLFDNSTMELGLKIKACEEVLVKGENKDVAFNKVKFIEKKETLTKGFIEKIVELKKAIDEAEEELNKAWEEKVIDKIVKASEHQKEKVKKTMDEFKEGGLKSGSGEKVTERKQAIAIALSQAGLSKKKKKKDNLVKGKGEGSKGGKVIGHTKSGKPIYENKKASDYKNFSEQDHRDAADLHHKHSETRGDIIGNITSKKYRDSHIDKFQKSMDTGNTPGKETPEGKNGKATTIAAATSKDNIQKAVGEDNSGNYVAIICTDEKNRVLLMKRKDGLGWMLPGGHIEPGESTIEATKREFKEETNLDVKIEDFFEVGDEKLPDGKNICFYRTYKNLVNGQLANIDKEDEAADIQCFSAEEWLKLDMFKDTKEYLKKFLLPSYIKKGDFTSKEYQDQLQKSLALVKEAIREGILEKDFIEK